MTPQLHQELSAFLGMTIGIFAEDNAFTEIGTQSSTDKFFTQSEHLGGMFRREAQRLLRRIEKDEREAILGVELDEILKDAESVEVAEI